MIRNLILLALALNGGIVNAVPDTSGNEPTGSNSANVNDSNKKSIKDYLGMTYFVFFNGPGLLADRMDATPGAFGTASNNGINTFNVLSFRYKLNPDLGIDFQTRSQVFYNARSEWNASDTKRFSDGRPRGFQNFRWESPRLGISGMLIKGKEWKLKGALNTDLPHFLPEPFTGFIAKQRTVLFSPGLFANLTYNPTGSRWSLFSIVSPRFLFYSDRTAVTPDELNSGFKWQNKPELVLEASPTVNYQLTEKVDISVGTRLIYTKQVGSSWNPFDATMVSNSVSPSWVLAPLPLTTGVAVKINSALRLYPFIQTFPIASQRVDARTGAQAGFLETASIGMWINGTIL